MNQQHQGAASARHRRADAERSIEAILDAVLEHVQGGGTLNMAAIARAAGLSRVTLYTHFPTREALMAAAVERSVTRAQEALNNVDLEHVPPTEALARLVRSSWQVLDQNRNLYRVASTSLPASRLRASTEPVLGLAASLIGRGQGTGDFRTDLPREWLVETTYTLMHLAAEQVNENRMPAAAAGDIITDTIVSLLTHHPSSGGRSGGPSRSGTHPAGALPAEQQTGPGRHLDYGAA